MNLREMEKRIMKIAKNSPTTTCTTYKCEICKDREFILEIDEEGYERATPCKCRARNELERTLEYGGISKIFRTKRFENFKAEDENLAGIKAKCLEYAKAGENSILLTGQVGSGKTHLAMAIANIKLDKGLRVVYADYRSFITRLKQNITDSEEYNKSLSKLQEADVLLLDDLYKGKITESDTNIMYELINYRYLTQKNTIITSELDIRQILEIDEGVGSRIYEMAKGNAILFKGKNYRLLK